jgi:glycosyltransferase involved in cell wall biosynthesis
VNLAIVHDWLNQIGGAEDVLETLVGMFPGVPVYTSIYWRERMPPAYRAWDIRTAWMDRLPSIYRRHQLYFLLYPLFFSRLDLSNYRIVLSNKSGFCHGVRTGEAVHVCYCLSPTRYVWDFGTYATREAIPPVLRMVLRSFIALLRRWDYQAAQRVDPLLRRWDYQAAQRVDHFVAISREVRARIQRFYHRESTIIYPPVDTSCFQPATAHDDYYLIVSRLVPYRRIDLAVQAFNRLELPLVVVGDGRDRAELESMAGPTITFTGRLPDEDLPDLFARCRAYILPGVEDFGIAPLQAQAAGRPVIALGAGGALDTVKEGRTGVFFYESSAEALVVAVRDFDVGAVDPQDCVDNAARFDVKVFQERLNRFLAEVLEE